VNNSVSQPSPFRRIGHAVANRLTPIIAITQGYRAGTPTPVRSPTWKISKGHQRLNLKCPPDRDINVSSDVDGGFARLMVERQLHQVRHVHAGFL
jgi:hypothetical protein